MGKPGNLYDGVTRFDVCAVEWPIGKDGAVDADNKIQS